MINYKIKCWSVHLLFLGRKKDTSQLSLKLHVNVMRRCALHSYPHCCSFTWNFERQSWHRQGYCKDIQWSRAKYVHYQVNVYDKMGVTFPYNLVGPLRIMIIFLFLVIPDTVWMVKRITVIGEEKEDKNDENWDCFRAIVIHK